MCFKKRRPSSRQILVKSIYFFAFQRQSLLKTNIIPKFSSTSLWKHVLICFLPLVALFLAFFTVAFTADSLGQIITAIAFMLNPIIAIPLGYSMASIFDGIQRGIKKICKSPSSESKIKFTITAYFALICTFLVYLTHGWDTTRDIFTVCSLHANT